MGYLHIPFVQFHINFKTDYISDYISNPLNSYIICSFFFPKMLSIFFDFIEIQLGGER